MIRELLEKDAATWEKLGIIHPIRTLVLEHGTVHTPTKFNGRRGRPRMCYRNATLLMANRNDLRYVEGFAVSSKLVKIGFIVDHAWCVDADGNVQDPTWEDSENAHYMGIEFSNEFVLARICKKGTYGVLTNEVGFVDLDFIYEHWPEYRGRTWQFAPETGCTGNPDNCKAPAFECVCAYRKQS